MLCVQSGFRASRIKSSLDRWEGDNYDNDIDEDDNDYAAPRGIGGTPSRAQGAVHGYGITDSAAASPAAAVGKFKTAGMMTPYSGGGRDR